MIRAVEETWPREHLARVQLERIRNQVRRAWDHVPLYRKKMEDAGVKPDDIVNLDDVRHLPFLNKQDFRDVYPFGLLAVSRDEIVRIHASSGTTGKPTVVGYTKNDMTMWTESVTRTVVAAGARPDDVAQISFGYGMFTGALGLHYGLENLGCAVIPASVGNTQRQLMYLQDYGATVLIATPSYALYLAEQAIEEGYKPAEDFKLRLGLLGGEGLTEGMRRELIELWGEQFLPTQNYGMSELNGPGMAGECTELTGMHVHEDLFYVEIIDPITGEVLPEGEEGELVVTLLTKEAMPLVRYRTHDLTTLDSSPCPCGRTTARISAMAGRSDDMLLIRGVNVFPNQIAEVIDETEGISAVFEIHLDRVKHLDTFEVKVELVDAAFLESYAKLEAMRSELVHKIRTITGLSAKISILAPRSLKRFEGKARRVYDLRDKT